MKSTTNHISALILGFLCLLISNTNLAQVKATSIDKIVAKVDDQIVLASEVEKGYNDFIASGRFFGTDIKCNVLEALVVNKLLLALAETDSITVQEDQVESELDRRIQYVLQGRDPKLLEQQYGKSISALKDELRDQIRDELITQKMRSEITSGATITPTEVKKFYKTLPKDSLPFFSAEVQVGQIVINPPINKYEKDRIKNQLLDIKKRVENGERFAELASRYSQDVVSARDGGELGFFGRGDLVPEYEAAVLALEPGQTSDVVESQFGFHLIQMIERRGNRFNSRHILIKPSASSQDLTKASLILDSLKTKILEDRSVFEKLATKYSVDPITSSSGGFFTNRNDGSVRVQMQDLDPGLFFILDTMRVGNISQPISYQAPDGKTAMRIIYYKDKIPPHEANLKDDYQKIQTAALEAKRSKLLNDWFNEAKLDVYLFVDEDYDKCNTLNK